MKFFLFFFFLNSLKFPSKTRYKYFYEIFHDISLLRYLTAGKNYHNYSVYFNAVIKKQKKKNRIMNISNVSLFFFFKYTSHNFLEKTCLLCEINQSPNHFLRLPFPETGFASSSRLIARN